MANTYLVVKHPNHWVPRDAIEFLRTHSYLWEKLSSGEAVELTEGQYSKVKKYVEVIKTTTEVKPQPKSFVPPVKLKDDTQTF